MPPLVAAMLWTSRITSIALEMAVPGLLGYWLDRRLGTGLVLLLVGVAIGFATGILSLIRLTREPPDDSHDR
ncbi:MAG: AtpZ/AtpI family protein [Thermoguttaceae bacterium]